MRFQLALKRVELTLPALSFEVIKQQQKNRAVHEAVATVSDVGMSAEIVRGLEGLIQIPIPCMVRHKTVVVTRNSIHGPIRRHNVWIVISAIHGFGGGFVPTGPC